MMPRRVVPFIYTLLGYRDKGRFITGLAILHDHCPYRPRMTLKRVTPLLMKGTDWRCKHFVSSPPGLQLLFLLHMQTRRKKRMSTLTFTHTHTQTNAYRQRRTHYFHTSKLSLIQVFTIQRGDVFNLLCATVRVSIYFFIFLAWVDHRPILHNHHTSQPACTNPVLVLGA